jgi:hypothetical protein
MESKEDMENKDLKTTKTETKTDAKTDAKPEATPDDATIKESGDSGVNTNSGDPVEDEKKAEAKKAAVKKKTLTPLTGTDRYDDMSSAEKGHLGSNSSEDDEAISGTGITQKMMKMSGDLRNDGSSDAKVFKADEEVKIDGEEVNGMVVVDKDYLKEEPIRGSDKMKKVLLYRKGTIVPKNQLVSK